MWNKEEPTKDNPNNNRKTPYMQAALLLKTIPTNIPTRVHKTNGNKSHKGRAKTKGTSETG